MLPPGFTLLALRLGVVVRGMVVNFLDVLALMVPSYNSVLKVNDALTVFGTIGVVPNRYGLRVY